MKNSNKVESQMNLKAVAQSQSTSKRKALVAAVLAISLCASSVSQAKYGGSRSYRTSSKPKVSQKHLQHREKHTRTERDKNQHQQSSKAPDSPQTNGAANSMVSTAGAALTGAALGYGASQLLNRDSGNGVAEKEGAEPEKTELQRSCESAYSRCMDANATPPSSKNDDAR